MKFRFHFSVVYTYEVLTQQNSIWQPRKLNFVLLGVIMGEFEYLWYRTYVRIWLPSEALYVLSTFETVSPIAFILLDNIPTIKIIYKISYQKGKRLSANYIGMRLYSIYVKLNCWGTIMITDLALHSWAPVQNQLHMSTKTNRLAMVHNLYPLECRLLLEYPSSEGLFAGKSILRTIMAIIY